MIGKYSSNYYKLLFLLLLVSFACKKTPEEEVDQEALCLPDPQYVSFQSQIDDAKDGDVIIVEPGTYEGLVDFKGKNITVASQYITDGDTSFISKTIIDAKGLGSGVRFANGETSDARLSGFTITGGLAPKGGGIYAKEASPTLDHLIITNNKTFDCSTDDNFYKGSGGGLYFEQSTAKLSHIMILRNSSSNSGGGIYLDQAQLELTDMVGIYDNTAEENGGGVYAYVSEIKSYHSTIIWNRSEDGAGLYMSTFSKINLLNSIIGNNQATSEGAGLYMINSDLVAVNSTIAGNIAEESGGGGYFEASEWNILNTVVTSSHPDNAAFKNTDGSNITLSYSGFGSGTEGVSNGSIDMGATNVNLGACCGALDMIHLEEYTGYVDFSGNLTSFCPRIPGWGTFLGEYIFTKSSMVDAGNPDPSYNDPEWSFCVDGGVPRVIDSGIDETPDSNSVRNDMGAFGGPGGNWLPYGYTYTSEVEDVNQ